LAICLRLPLKLRRHLDTSINASHTVRGQKTKFMIHLDENQVGQYGLLEDMQRRLDTLKELDLIEKLKPEFSRDGNQFCFLLGELPNDCVIGFGDTAAEAMSDFCTNFWNEKAIGNNDKPKK